MNLNGKTILITGGGSGIGLEAARQFLQIGSKVIITGRNQQKLDAAKKAYPTLVCLQSDAGNEKDAFALFEKVKELGGIDILYNNAGVGVPPKNLGIANDAHLKGATYEMEVNYLGVIRLNNLFMEMLKSRKESAIINTTSILSMVPSLVEATYSASKVALAFYTKSLREHLKITGTRVKVFELLPPLVDTDMVADRDDKKISTKQLIKGLIQGLKKDQYTIRVGDSRLIYIFSRFFPKFTFGLINPKKINLTLRS
ncbi:SDR family NAD(P)-dependent oxidoreductase [Pedobacter sp. MC2016-14]|uniref:SDR family oxidoreductase n=1 Tax=Pedobacter sp. MC2016-14 TaxID=2897327 RepID=UPI001E628BC6|nr:SDR family NAD(P)-dependent oxidoreductase [Pedobacter sp. MC2016-14]MCD0488794.1 SDR family NAD(P)-dependent oxidoreductase [Pedobacter sp. MC2016-14]